MVQDFMIPLNRDELLNSSVKYYSVGNIITQNMVPKALEDARGALQKDGASFILSTFDTFFSILVHGNKIELRYISLAFKRIVKGVKTLVMDMETIFDQGKDIEEEDRPKLLCLNKMLAYLISQFTCYLNEQMNKNSNTVYNTGKRKKNTKTDAEEWDDERQEVLELMYRWLQLPLHKLWKPPIVEDSFITTFSQVCYNILEHCKDAKQKHTRQTIFEILGTLTKRYNHGIICIVRIVQLVKLYEALPTHIAVGVVHMDVESGCSGFLKEVIKEIGQSEPVESESRNVSAFLEHVAQLKPDIMLPFMEEILEYLSDENYIMRNCAIGIIGITIPKVLTGEDLNNEQKMQRDRCLDNLYDHILDCSSYVRSKVLHVWQDLCCEGAIPLARQGKLLVACVKRLRDKSANVRKQALQLLRTLLQSNPFAAKLDHVEFSKSMEKEKIKLRKAQIQFVSNSASKDTERLELWNTLFPDIQKVLKEIISAREEKKNIEDNEKEEKDNIDPNNAFEKVRQLMLEENVSSAVLYLWKICNTLGNAPKLENLSPEAKEECLLAFLLKIFLESEDASNKEDARTEENESPEHKKKREEIKARKRIVNYLEKCLEFATEFKNAIPAVETLLFSTTSTDAVEACTLLGVACQFGVTGAEAAIREALFQAFNSDQSVRRNLALVYKRLYLDNTEAQKSKRQKAVACVESLINLIKSLQPGQSPALEELIVSWYNNNEISKETLQVLWEKFSMKFPGTTLIESRAALILIMMIGQTESGIIIDNLNVLVKIGFGPKAENDLLLARDTCRTLLRIKQDKSNIEVGPIRYPNNHNMFNRIIKLLVNHFSDTKENGYISFSTDAINVIYKLANQPEHLIKNFLLDILKREQLIGGCNTKIVVPSNKLSKLLHLVGHIAISEMVHLDTTVYKELKRRNHIRDLKKNKNSKDSTTVCRENSVTSAINSANRNIRNKESSTLQEDNGEDVLEGAADDTDAEFINNEIESNIVTGNGLLAKFVPIVLDVCRHPEKCDNENLQAAGSIALCKMMTVSSAFCESSLQLLVTILERSPYPKIRANILIGLSDLITRFPNEVEPWLKHFYGRLRDENKHVRSTCVHVLSDLIMREMVRAKGQISELALCILDEDTQIQQDTKQFFKEFAQKGCALYNVIPDILSRLADPQLNLSESNFQEILGYILGLVKKEKQVDTMVKKICARFKLATTERQWCDLSYCLSILQFSAKGIRHLIESLPLLKDKIHHKRVLKTLRGIIEQTKKKSDATAACLELEKKIEKLLNAELDEQAKNSEADDNVLMPPPSSILRKKIRKVKEKDDEEDEDVDRDSNSRPASRNVSSKGTKKKINAPIVDSDSSSESDDEEDQSHQKIRRNQSATKRGSDNAETSTDEMSSNLNTQKSPGPSKRNKFNKTQETLVKTQSRVSTRLSSRSSTKITRSSARLSKSKK